MPTRLVFIGLLLALPATAQPVPTRDPGSTHIYPAGGRRGTVVPVRVGAECFPPGATFRLVGDGVKAPPTLENRAPADLPPSPRRLPDEVPICYPKEWESVIDIAAGAEPGTRLWSLSCARGGTGYRPFLVGDLPEFLETEPNSVPSSAERITLPVTLNGRVAGERDVDCFVFAGKAGDTVVFDVMAARLGSPLDPVVDILDARGRECPVQRLPVGGDPVVALKVPADGDYVLRLSHIAFHGGPAHVYRIDASTSPYVCSVFPAGGRTGETRLVEFTALSGTSTPRVFRESVTFPETVGAFAFRGSSGGSTQPMNRVELIAGELDEVAVGDTSSANPATLALPCAASVRANTEQWLSFTAARDETLSFVGRPHPTGSSMLPALALFDAAGKELRRIDGANTPDHECRFDWRALLAGTYRLRVRDLQRGIAGAAPVLRLVIGKSQPDFALTAASDAVSVTPGATVDVNVTATRRGGLHGPIDLTVEGLPQGVTAAAVQIPAGQTAGKLVLTAGAARPADINIRVVGTAAVGDKPIRRRVRARHLGTDSEGVGVGSATVDHLHLTVRHKPVFRLTCSEAYQYAHRGSVYGYAMEVERLDGFDGEIHLQLGDRQNRDLDGVDVLPTVIPPGVTKFFAPFHMPETMHINVQSQSQVYVQAFARFRDKWGGPQSVLVVSEMRCLIRTLPPVAKLKALAGEVVVEVGSTVTAELRLDRAAFHAAAEITLIDPAPGFRAETVRLEPGKSVAVVTVQVDRSAAGDTVLKFRAVGPIEGGSTLRTEATLPVKLRRTPTRD